MRSLFPYVQASCPALLSNVQKEAERSAAEDAGTDVWRPEQRRGACTVGPVEG